MGIPIRLAEAGGKAKSRGSLKSSNYVQVRCSDQVPWLHPLCCGARVCLLRTRMHGVPCSNSEWLHGVPCSHSECQTDVAILLCWGCAQHGEELQIRIKAHCPFQLLSQVQR